MKTNPDNRKDNVERIQENINMTIQNMEQADEMIEETSDDKMRESLKEKNGRREDALKGLRGEIRDEAAAREKGYKQ